MIGGTIALVGLLPVLRFLALWAMGDGAGHIQSLVLGGALIVMGTLTGLLGVLAELIGANRKLLEATLQRLHRLEDRMEGLGVSPTPSHLTAHDQRDAA